MYDAVTNDDRVQFPMLLEEVGLEPLEVPLETESPEAQGSVEDTLKLEVESEATSWRAWRLICLSRLESRLCQ